MDPRWFAALGAVVGLGLVANVATAGFAPTALPWFLVVALWVTGGLGFGDVPWYRPVGTGNLVAGIAVMAEGFLAYGGSLPEQAFAVATVVGGFGLAFVGVEWLRGGDYVERPSASR